MCIQKNIPAALPEASAGALSINPSGATHVSSGSIVFSLKVAFIKARFCLIPTRHRHLDSLTPWETAGDDTGNGHGNGDPVDWGRGGAGVRKDLMEGWMRACSLMRDGCRCIPMPVPALGTAPSRGLGWGLGLLKGLVNGLRRLVAELEFLARFCVVGLEPCNLYPLDPLFLSFSSAHPSFMYAHSGHWDRQQTIQPFTHDTNPARPRTTRNATCNLYQARRCLERVDVSVWPSLRHTLNLTLRHT